MITNDQMGGVTFGPNAPQDMLWPFLCGAALATAIILFWIWRKK